MGSSIDFTFSLPMFERTENYWRKMSWQWSIKERRILNFIKRASEDEDERKETARELITLKLKFY